MTTSGGGSDGDVGFQIAPMIDLILVLMVFFMSTVALKQTENELGVDVPGTGGDKDIPLTIAIDVDGSVSVNNENLAAATDRRLDQFRDRLKTQVALFGEKSPVVIFPQPDVRHGRVIDVLNACSASKIKNISFEGG